MGQLRLGILSRASLPQCHPAIADRSGEVIEKFDKYRSEMWLV
jgi:hypothetical protein